MLNIWRWYQNCLSVHPVRTQVATSGILWAAGDIVAQSMISFSAAKRRNLCISAATSYTTDGEDNFLQIDWKRVAVTSMFGFGFIGPTGHLWYEWLDQFMRLRLNLQARSVQFVVCKVAMDSLIFGPLSLLAFLTYMGFSSGKNTSIYEVKESVKRDFMPALILEGGVWPFIQMVNFGFVHVRYQLLYVNLFCLLDSVFLSWMEQQKDVAWKQRFVNSLRLKGIKKP
ncbi:protein SYM1-like isoform X2 [Impatiens glandulifera]|uniref:protein SYM1-like isoform X2 n=1 Tax=Impatiens glandulifera TaxID=253017 RepID=UPI001FB06346|nr:protein SYM1-like isoform X2 [Impatiens glandulifera]